MRMGGNSKACWQTDGSEFSFSFLLFSFSLSYFFSSFFLLSDIVGGGQKSGDPAVCQYRKQTKIRTICVSKMGQVGCNRRNTRSCHLCFFFYPAVWIFFFISSSSLSIFIFTDIHAHILIWALASGVGSFLVLLPFLNLWEAFFFPLPVLDYT